jgi:hypothetical protein
MDILQIVESSWREFRNPQTTRAFLEGLKDAATSDPALRHEVDYITGLGIAIETLKGVTSWEGHKKKMEEEMVE